MLRKLFPVDSATILSKKELPPFRRPSNCSKKGNYDVILRLIRLVTLVTVDISIHNL